MKITRTGPLPKVMPVSLEILNLGDNWRNINKFTGGLPAEWSWMTNLKELKMHNCGLDGGWYGLSTYTAQKRIIRSKSRNPF